MTYGVFRSEWNWSKEPITVDYLAMHEVENSKFPMWVFFGLFQLTFGGLIIMAQMFKMMRHFFNLTHEVVTILMILDCYQSITLLVLSYFLMFSVDKPYELILNMVALNVFVTLDDDIIKTYWIGKSKESAKETLLLYFEDDNEEVDLEANEEKGGAVMKHSSHGFNM